MSSFTILYLVWYLVSLIIFTFALKNGLVCDTKYKDTRKLLFVISIIPFFRIFIFLIAIFTPVMISFGSWLDKKLEFLGGD